MPSSTSVFSTEQRYAIGALFAVALHQAQIQQTRSSSLLASDGSFERQESIVSTDSITHDTALWVNESLGLLRPILRFFEIESAAWHGIEETAASSVATYHVGAFLRLLSEELSGGSQSAHEEVALSKAVNAMEKNLQVDSLSTKSKKEKFLEYENECRGKTSNGKVQTDVEFETPRSQTPAQLDFDLSEPKVDGDSLLAGYKAVEIPTDEEKMLSYHRKVLLLHDLLLACLANVRDDDKHWAEQRRGYDARHRAALRLLATWLDIKWIKMEAIELIVACTAMSLSQSSESNKETTDKAKWARWKRGGIIGAAAITGGTLMAVTGGLAAPAIAAGFSALAPILGSLVPIIGASGFAAAASAAGTVAGSVAVAASFGAAGAGLAGTKMARRIGNVDEFEFIVIGEKNIQGRLAVAISVSGFVFEVDDFVRPWEGINDKCERYVLQWESRNLIAVSTAIQDWLTSRIALELMKQGAMMTVLNTLLAALAWPATILAATDFIDSKWAIAVDRSDKVGKLLAEVLLKGLHGNRPVTLVGYSLGARVIFKCLQTLAETEHNDGIVERVVLLGAPISIKDENWKAARKMVAGRFVNVYSTNDWILGVAFRASLFAQGLAGIQAVNVFGIQNVDVTNLIEGHSSYLWATPQILENLELDAYFPVYNAANYYK